MEPADHGKFLDLAAEKTASANPCRRRYRQTPRPGPDFHPAFIQTFDVFSGALSKSDQENKNGHVFRAGDMPKPVWTEAAFPRSLTHEDSAASSLSGITIWSIPLLIAAKPKSQSIHCLCSPQHRYKRFLFDHKHRRLLRWKTSRDSDFP